MGTMGRKVNSFGLVSIGLIVTGTLVFWILRNPFPKLDVPDGGAHLVAAILEIPEAPNPKTVEYADCLSVAKVQILKVMEGDKVPREMLVAFRIISNRKLTGAAFYKAGDYIEITLLKRDQVEESLLTMQRILEADDYDLNFFYASDSYRWEPQTVTPFLSVIEHDKRSLSQSGSEVSVTFQDRRTDSSRQIRREAIEADISRIHNLRAKHGNSWEQWVEDVQPWRENLYKRVHESGGGILKEGRFFRKFHGHFYQEFINEGEEASAFRMIRALHAELDHLGIDLIVVPFPFKEEVYGDHFLAGAPEDGVMVPERLRMVLDFLEAGVEVLDLTEALRSNSDQQSLFYPYEDPHPADRGIQVAAATIDYRLKRYQFPPDIYGLKTQLIQFTMPAEFQKRREDNYRFMPLDPTYPATLIKMVSGERLPEGLVSSPLLVLGDSFTRCPDLYGPLGGNVRDHLAFQTGVNPASLSVHGSAGQTMSNLALEGNAFLANRQVAIFIFSSSRMFTQQFPEGHADREWKVVPFAERFKE